MDGEAPVNARRPRWWAVGVVVALVAVVGLAACTLWTRDDAPDVSAAGRTAAAPSAPKGLKVLVTGDSVAWAIGAFAPAGDDLPRGIASIDSRAMIGCGLLTPEGWGYPQGGNDGPFTIPGGGRCEAQPDAERKGLAERPDVVLIFPGAWEWSRVRSPNGQIIEARSPAMEATLRARLERRIEAANAVGARLVVVAYSCPGPDTAPVRKDPAFIAWIDGLLRSVVDDARREGADARFLEPTDAVCVDADPTGAPTPERSRATSNEIHVKSPEGGAWIWNAWLAPGITS